MLGYRGLRAVSQAAASRAPEKVQGLATAAAGGRLNGVVEFLALAGKIHLCAIPLGPVMRTVAFEELIAAAPIIIAPGANVAMAGAVKLLTPPRY